ncbi:helix-turn-helix domain-containing protein [Flammeovirga aprica]|uniref:Rrf2 family transcriptional regulator n=1 Tax=Flammeovirga aprica JL-4 TaxID=694437 RepID=A0A7X9RYQ8_9BACT|nr:hypothetical protein [Flammeovirga aprica]NME71168.1 Rrf2 family transcriptional regulator [Flammeovirga aprica JL-4]
MSLIFELIKEKKINTTEAVILQFYTLNNSFTEPNAIVAEELNVSLSVVSRAKRKLIKLGLIEIQKNYTNGLARDADTVTTNQNILELFGLGKTPINNAHSEIVEEVIVDDESLLIEDLVKKHLRKSSRPITLSNIATQISKIDGKIKPKLVEKYKAVIIREIENQGYRWHNNSVFATLL